MLFYLVVFGFLWLYPYHLIATGTYPRFNLMATLPGIIFTVSFVAYLSAIRISLSQTILFQSYSILVTIFLTAVYLGEGKYFDVATVSGLKVIIGIILAIVSLWFLLHVGRKKEELLERRWFLYILLVIFFGGTGSFLSIWFLTNSTPQEMIINQSYSMFILLFVLIKIYRKKLLIGNKATLLIFVSSFFASIAVVSFYEVLKQVAVSKILPVQQVSLVVLTMLSAVIFYKESNIFSGRRLIGMVMGLVGIIMLVTS
ncbi:hypothetical protein A2960_05630 [Candidatus Gottesmanbacteria bacterium RIFCSPLOWO2_01_FULL_39_12b]|uniref:EamA domain-containing protein n=1 Tax=Candidatus Gottesmanbacteria bacterium RIFCSPLOWO2_01_FULL_39_12b TaxID=1798388 RepID=A0A1F6AP04_9BACT|nr:MAG: hypothetical protein A2960_05630 [Candidatus Gottesmanbacteria bacterium RIFCSPLOWO2_01_FULL_39_12b]